MTPDELRRAARELVATWRPPTQEERDKVAALLRPISPRRLERAS